MTSHPAQPAIPAGTAPRERLDHYPISPQPQPGETGFLAFARDLARTVCSLVDGRRWHAEATSPAWPSRNVDQHTQVRIAVDDRYRISLTETRPAGGAPEQWSITVNGRPIPHRTLPGEVPHHVTPVARSIWRHLNNISVDPCDRLLCREPATVATYRGSTCRTHATAGTAAARPAPSTAPSAALPAPGRGAGRGAPPRHQQPKGKNR